MKGKVNRVGLGVLILGESGSGKSSSLRNFKKSDVLIFNVAGKRLPFKQGEEKLNTVNLRFMNGSERYEVITSYLLKYQEQCKIFVIDDSQYLMAFEEINRWAEKGYEKFSQMALHFTELMDTIASLNDDVIVYLLHHTELDDYGRLKAKTVGKMIDSKLTLEGLFEVVLMAFNDKGHYCFVTHNDGRATTKSPMGMFDQDEVDNDLKIVDKTIREYFEM